MNKSFSNLNSINCIDGIDTRLHQMMGILITLEAAMESKNGFMTIQPVAKHAVTAALNMAEECEKLNHQALEMLQSRFQVES